MFKPAALPVILLAAIDLSDVSPLVARRAREAARQMNAAQLHFVHVRPRTSEEAPSARDCEWFGVWIAAQLQGGDVLPPYTQVLAHESSGDPAQSVVELAAKLRASCIVVGARSQGKEDGRQLGSIARAIMGAAECPVLVVRPESQAHAGARGSLQAAAH
jgi:nucleotide-binding universal stress UspA family protein